MKKRCDDCGELFKVEENPRKSVKVGKFHKEKLCPKCWKKVKDRTNANRKGGKRFGKGSAKGFVHINTHSPIYGASMKESKELILKRNNEIDKLRKIVDRISKENIKLKEELKIKKCQKNYR